MRSFVGQLRNNTHEQHYEAPPVQPTNNNQMSYDLSSASEEQSAINSSTELYSHVLKHAATKRRVQTGSTEEPLKCTQPQQ